MAKSKHNAVLPLPGNSNATQNFNKEQEWKSPDDSNNGNIGFDDAYGGKPAKALTGPGSFIKNLRGGR